MKNFHKESNFDRKIFCIPEHTSTLDRTGATNQNVLFVVVETAKNLGHYSSKISISCSNVKHHREKQRQKHWTDLYNAFKTEGRTCIVHYMASYYNFSSVQLHPLTPFQFWLKMSLLEKHSFLVIQNCLQELVRIKLRQFMNCHMNGI